MDGRARSRRRAHSGAAPDDPVPAEVSALVVRLELRAAQLLEPRLRLSRLNGRSLSLDRRAPVGATRVPLPGRARGTKPLAPAREVVPRNPALRRVDLSLDRGD